MPKPVTMRPSRISASERPSCSRLQRASPSDGPRATGGLQPHHRDSVCGWIARYQTEGLAGLLVRKGRGRKPASFPCAR